MKQYRIQLASAILILAAAFAAWHTSKHPVREFAAVGPKVENFALMDHTGRMMELYRQANAKAVVLISYGIGCPVVRKNLPAVSKLREKYRRDGVRFFMIDGNSQDTREKLEEEAKAFAIEMPLLIDETQEVLHSLNVDRTGEALLIETGSWKIIYRGPIDDRLGYGVDKLAAKQNYLDTAITQFLAGKLIEKNQVQAVGCAINFAPPVAVEYHKDVAPLVRKNCGGCHRENGGVPPTNLWTYNDVKGWAKMIREVIRTERMPPWEVDPHVSEVTNDRHMSAQAKRVIYDWLETGLHEGQPGAAPTAYKPPPKRKIKWDFTLKMKREILIPADTKTPWHYEMLMSNAPEDIWISAIGFDLTNRSIVQHIALVVTNSPLDLSKNGFQPESEQGSKLSSIIRMNARYEYGPILPEGLALKIPKGSYVYLEMHFDASGKGEREFASFNFKKYQGAAAPKELVNHELEVNRHMEIPPKIESYVVKTSRPVEHDVYLTQVGAHMHWRGVAAKLFVFETDGTKHLIYSSRYVFKNRMTYIFAKPIFVKGGSLLEAEFEYDNSPSNPAGIDFNKTVSVGPDAVNEEMGVMHIWEYAAGEANGRQALR